MVLICGIFLQLYYEGGKEISFHRRNETNYHRYKPVTDFTLFMTIKILLIENNHKSHTHSLLILEMRRTLWFEFNSRIHRFRSKSYLFFEPDSSIVKINGRKMNILLFFVVANTSAIFTLRR